MANPSPNSYFSTTSQIYAGRVAPTPPPPPPPPAPAPAITLVAGASSGTVGGASIAGPTISAPGGNAASVSWSLTSTPAGQTATPASGTLAPGASVTPTLNAVSAAIYAISVANNSGGTVNGAASPGSAGNVQWYAPIPPPPPPPAPTPGTTLTTLTLVGTDGAAKPFTAGMAFAKGHVPAANQIVLTGASVTAQTHVKNSWPDGSVKFAIIAGRATVSGGTAALAVSAGTQTLGAALDLTALQATGITASVTAGAFGSAVWTNGDFASPFHTWVSGPEMSSWVYRKQIGSDAHLVAWLRVRLFADGRVAVRAWVENGFVNVASPSNKSEVYTFTLGGTERYNSVAALDLKHHQRAVLLSGADLEHWIGTDPGVTVLHDRAYLQATELVPSVFANMAAGAAEVTRLPSTFTPLEQGVFDYGSDSMASTGYQRPIGPLPSHEVIYLTCHASDQATMARVVDRGGLNAGRYGIHYRDEATNRPLRFSDHSTRVIADGQGFKDNGSSTTGTRTPVATGGNPPQWDTAHSPAVGYMAYLLTGDWYHMETALFAATCNYLGNGDNSLLRTGAQGLVQTAVDAWQTRACAWDWRSKIMALTVVPDADPAPGGSGNTLRQELINCVEANVAHFHGRYVAQANNDFGLILPGETYSATLDEIAIWQQHFVTAMFGWSVCMDLPIGATPKSNLAAFFQWKAKSSVWTLGTSSEFWYINASAYTVKLGGSPRSQSAWTAGTGPWPANAAALYAATITPSAPAWFGSTDGTLAGEFLPDYTAACTSMQGNMMPALAYAVRLAVPGASAAYNRLTAATNWSNYVTAFNARPTWAHKPLRDPVATPAWMSAAVLNRYTALPNSAGSGGAAMDAWGAIVVTDDLDIVSAAPGGHGDSYDNRTVRYAAGADSPAGPWAVVNAASTQVPPPTADAAYYYDTGGTNPKPGSRHHYDHQIYDPATRKVYLIGYLGTYPNGLSKNTIDGISVDSWVWDAPGTHPYCGTTAAVSGSNGVVVGVYHDKGTGKVFWQADDANLWEWAPGSATKTSRYTRFEGAYGGYGPFGVLPNRYPTCYDSDRSAIFGMQFNGGQGGAPGSTLTAGIVFNPSNSTPTASVITFNSSAAKTQLLADLPAYAAIDYDRLRGRYVFLAGGTFNSAGAVSTSDPFRLYDVIPNGGTTWDIDFTPVASTAVNPGSLASGGLNKRWQYIGRGGVGGFILLMNVSGSLHFFRTT